MGKSISESNTRPERGDSCMAFLETSDRIKGSSLSPDPHFAGKPLLGGEWRKRGGRSPPPPPPQLD